MKSTFSTSWLCSKQPRKQRKYLHNAPLHTRHKFLNAPLSKILRKKYGKRSMPVRKGDEVLVMRGSFKKKKAKVSSVDLKRSKITLEGIQRSKRDGTKVPIRFNANILQIQELFLEDKKRIEKLSKKTAEKITDSKEKPKEKKHGLSKKTGSV
jgi:large subunit ribosomal protein L24